MTLRDGDVSDAPATMSKRLGLEASRSAVFLDVDGTLLGFKPHPGDVVADADLLRLLDDLRRALGGALALVSGRTIADLDRIMAPLVLPAAGIHGAELRFPNGSLQNIADVPALAAARLALKSFAAENGDLLVEDKGAAATLHYRNAPHLERPVIALFDELVAGHDELVVQHGKFVAEVKSRAHTKGTAVETFMETEPFRGRFPVFVGDDLTDEFGFAALNARGGLSVKVGEGETAARERLAGVDEVRAFLWSLCAAPSAADKRP